MIQRINFNEADSMFTFLIIYICPCTLSLEIIALYNRSFRESLCYILISFLRILTLLLILCFVLKRKIDLSKAKKFRLDRRPCMYFNRLLKKNNTLNSIDKTKEYIKNYYKNMSEYKLLENYGETNYLKHRSDITLGLMCSFVISLIFYLVTELLINFIVDLLNIKPSVVFFILLFIFVFIVISATNFYKILIQEAFNFIKDKYKDKYSLFVLKYEHSTIKDILIEKYSYSKDMFEE